MNVSLVVKIKVPTKVRREILASWRAIAKAAQRVIKKPYAEVALVMVDDADMISLNRRYRGRNKTTDVLSFTYQVSPIVGEVVVSWPQVKRQAAAAGHSLNRELEVLLTHGLVHLAGYDHVRLNHRKIMRQMEKRVSQLAGHN